MRARQLRTGRNRRGRQLGRAVNIVAALVVASEMDEERRLGEGRLAQLGGPTDLASDEFELRLGLLRTAQAERAQLPKDGQAAQALTAYAQGVNARLAQVRAGGQWPAVFSLPGVYPGPWTPVDSLVIQGILTQELDFTSTPLDYALLERSLGAARTMDWFPLIAKNAQTPYDPGPYAKSALTPLAPAVASTAPVAASDTPGNPARRHAASPGPATLSPAITTPASTDATAAGTSPAVVSGAQAQAAATLLAQFSRLAAGQLHEYPDSNAWAANGPAVAGGGALLAGDPHLPQTLPSIWYEAALSAPGFAVTGVSVPGLPGILIGHNARIAWSLTDTQNQGTMFYDEKTRPGEYYWDGAWRTMQVAHYTIAVRGAATRQLTVDITVHGPIMTQAGQTTSVDWMGNVPSPDLQALLNINQAGSFAQFKTALASWYAPPSHLLATANQRPVTAAYPYYIGTTANFFDPGYRAATIYAALRSRTAPLTPASFAVIQTSLADELANRIRPVVLSALGGASLSSSERAAVQLLGTWNATMAPSSPAATIWRTFWNDYLSEVFQPWWSQAKVPVHKDSGGLAVSADQVSLDEDLEAWTLGDPANPAFSLPSGSPRTLPSSSSRTAPQVIRKAFAAAVAHLSWTLGGAPSSWAWDRLQSREFPALSGADGLGYGPRPSGGDAFTPDAADGGLTATAGPSWRMIVSLSSAGVTAEGVYPGGQSEDPAFPWYADQIPLSPAPSWSASPRPWSPSG
jgi:penicillin amidase